jgi:hypothetical protein
MALLAGRSSWRASDKYSSDQVLRKLRDVRASLVVVARPGTEFAITYPTPPSLALQIQDHRAQVLFRNQLFEVIQLNRLGKNDPPTPRPG